MKYKEFRAWCNQRAADGCWGMMTAMFCIHILKEVNEIPFWKREKVWKEKYEEEIMRYTPVILMERCVKAYIPT